MEANMSFKLTSDVCELGEVYAEMKNKEEVLRELEEKEESLTLIRITKEDLYVLRNKYDHIKLAVNRRS
jgi:hypothetical protein